MSSDRDRFQHKCKLPKQYFTSQIRSPFQTWIGRFTAYFRCIRQASAYCDSIQYFPSRASLNKEQRRQATRPEYKNIIHPFSVLNRIRDTIVSTVWLVLVVFEAYVGTFYGHAFYEKQERSIITMFLLGMNMVMLLDCVCRFFTGFLKEKVRLVILDPNVIMKTYLKTYFVCDAFPILSFVLIYWFPISPKVKVVIFQFHKLRLGRLPSLVVQFDNYMLSFKLQQATRTAIMVLALFFMCVHQWTCIYGYCNLLLDTGGYEAAAAWSGRQLKHFKTEDTDNVKIGTLEESVILYYLHFCVTFSLFSGCMPANLKNIHPHEMFLLALVMMTGFAFFIFAASEILDIFKVVNISDERYEEFFFQMTNYMLQRNFTKHLQDRLTKYIDYKYNKKFFSEDAIFLSLSEHLRMEVLLFSCRSLISRIPLFKGLSKSAIGSMLAFLQQEIYLNDDKIMTTQKEADSIFFIHHGTCGLMLESERELTHLEDGEFFGKTNDIFVDQIGIVFDYSVVALEISEIYEFKLNDLEFCCVNHPEIVQKLQKVIQAKVKLYNALFLQSEEDDITDEILMQLANKKIISRGLKREEFIQPVTDV